MAHSSAPTDRVTPEASREESLLLKLPRELRNRIYDYVFGSSKAISPARPRLSQKFPSLSRFDEDFVCDELIIDNPIHTSILSVSRFVKAEAIEILYDTKVLRGDIASLGPMLQRHDIYSRARWVEITTSIANGPPEEPRDYQTFLDLAQQMPRVRSITILSDCLVDIRVQGVHKRVTSYIRELGLGKATCIDIGRYQLHGKFEHVQIVNRKLADMWPAVRATPEDYNGVHDALAIIDSIGTSRDMPNVLTWASHTSLRCWVDIQQQCLGMLKSGKWGQLVEKASTGVFEESEINDDDSADKLTYSFFHGFMDHAMWVPIHRFRLLGSGDYILRKLRPHDNSQLLDEVSEFLAMNITGYKRFTGDPSAPLHYYLYRAVWSDSWEGTGRTTLQYMAEQQAIASSGGDSVEFIPDPSVPGDLPANRVICREVARRWIVIGGHVSWMLSITDTACHQKLKQLTYLTMAISSNYGLGYPDTINAYYRQREPWAVDLLRRYILASGDLTSAERTTVSNASIGDLRKIVLVVLTLLENDKNEAEPYTGRFMRDENPPEDFDGDLFPQVGWKYRELFAQVFRRCFSQQGFSQMLADDLIEEGLPSEEGYPPNPEEEDDEM